MNPIDSIGRYFWAICLAFSLFNYAAARRRLNRTMTGHRERAEAALDYLRWFAIAGAVPWLVMGFGQVVGGVPSVWSYFRPQDFDPYVTAWLASNFLLAVVFAVWVFAADGARKTSEFELLFALGLRTEKPIPEAVVKLFAALGPFFVLSWIYLAAAMDAPIPTPAR